MATFDTLKNDFQILRICNNTKVQVSITFIYFKIINRYKSTMDYYDSDGDYDAFGHMSGDPLDFYTNGYGGFGYDTSHVPKDDQKAEITKKIEEGNLNAVKRIVQAATEKDKVINTARRWTEVDYRASGFTKEYEWFDLTPLATAARKGQDDIVQYLLEQGADPTLEGCPEDNVHLNALSAANEALGRTMASRNRSSCNKPRRCVDLLSVAEIFWNNSSYSSSRYSATERQVYSNRPKDMNLLLEALNEVKDISLYPKESLKSDQLKSLKERYKSRLA